MPANHRELPGVVPGTRTPRLRTTPGPTSDSYNAGRRGSEHGLPLAATSSVAPACGPGTTPRVKPPRISSIAQCAHDGHRSLSGPGRPDDAPESQVTRRRIDRLGKPGRGPIAAAVVRRAQVRAPFDHLARDLDVRLARIVAFLRRATPRVAWNAARLRLAMRTARCIPVGRPLPDVAGHVEKAVSVGGKRIDRRRPLVSVGPKVLPWELSLPEICHRPAVRHQLVAPGVFRAVVPAAGRELPLRFSRERFPAPPSIRLRVGICDVDHGIVAAAADGGIGANRDGASRHRGRTSTSCGNRAGRRARRAS